VHEDITALPLPFSCLQIILSFWGIVNITCFLVPAVPCLPILRFSEAIMIGKWDQQIQITQDKNHGISCHWWNSQSYSWNCFPQMSYYQDLKIDCCLIKRNSAVLHSLHLIFYVVYETVSLQIKNCVMSWINWSNWKHSEYTPVIAVDVRTALYVIRFSYWLLPRWLSGLLLGLLLHISC